VFGTFFTAQRSQRVLDVLGAVAARHPVRHTLADAVAVLEAVGPGALVLGAAGVADADAVAALEALRPLALVHPALLLLHAQAVPLARHPLAEERVAARPHVNAAHLLCVVEINGEINGEMNGQMNGQMNNGG